MKILQLTSSLAIGGVTSVVSNLSHELMKNHEVTIGCYKPYTDEITIDTVERYQGSQRDIIIYSTTISQRYQLDILSVPVRDGELWIDRKLNVAITRAKKQFFLTGNYDLLIQNDIYRDFLETEAVSQEITLEQCRAVPFHTRIARNLLKMFAPLM